MKIDDTLLSIPPYISVTWSHVVSLHTMQEDGKLHLVIDLVQGSRVVLPPLPDAVLDKIFEIHSSFSQTQHTHKPEEKIEEFVFPLKIGSESIEGMGNMMQHNPEQASAPDLPPPLLEKISHIAKAMGMMDSQLLPKPEPHCNCPHCQIARAMEQKEQIETDEEVSPEDLRFHEWDIEQKGKELYLVSNPLDHSEQYTVFLGSPVGCNCGKENCEHIKAVLKS